MCFVQHLLLTTQFLSGKTVAPAVTSDSVVLYDEQLNGFFFLCSEHVTDKTLHAVKRDLNLVAVHCSSGALALVFSESAP
jgi:hypothetical protein